MHKAKLKCIYKTQRSGGGGQRGGTTGRRTSANGYFYRGVLTLQVLSPALSTKSFNKAQLVSSVLAPRRFPPPTSYPSYLLPVCTCFIWRQVPASSHQTVSTTKPNQSPALRPSSRTLLDTPLIRTRSGQEVGRRMSPEVISGDHFSEQSHTPTPATTVLRWKVCRWRAG